jgi:hypothetical protein
LYRFSRNNPVRYADPNGLRVLAFCEFVSGGEALGAGILRCDLQAECFRNESQRGKYFGIFGGATVGIPIGATFFSVDFCNAYDVKEMAGTASLWVTSIAFGPGKSMGQICLGKQCSCADPSEFQDQLGLDISADFFGGYGWVYFITTQKCCE